VQQLWQTARSTAQGPQPHTDRITLLRMATCTEPEVLKYMQRHKIQLLFETLSSMLVTHRPPEPWAFLSECLDRALVAEAALSERNKRKNTFCDLLQREAPIKQDNHPDGRPVTKLGERPGNFTQYLTAHHIKEMFENILEFLITRGLPDKPEEAVFKYCQELAKAQEARAGQGGMESISEG